MKFCAITTEIYFIANSAYVPLPLTVRFKFSLNTYMRLFFMMLSAASIY